MFKNCGSWQDRKARAMLRASQIAALLCASFLNVNDANAQMPCHYEVTSIIQGPPCSITGLPASTAGVSISPNGQYVCGYWQCVTTTHAFVYDTTTHQFTTLPWPAGFSSSYASHVNDAGVVVGQLVGSPSKGFIYDITTGQYNNLLTGYDGASYCAISGINASGTVCGTRRITGGFTSAFRWTYKGGYVDLGLINNKSTEGYAINDAGAVTGMYVLGNIRRAFIWANGRAVDMGSLAGLSTEISSINNSGLAAGYSDLPSNSPRAVIWKQEAGMINLGTFAPFTSSLADAIGTNDVVVGLCRKSSGSDHAFVWSKGLMCDLNAMASSPAVTTILEASAIDAHGTIVADANMVGSGLGTIILSPSRTVPGDVTSNCKVDVDDLLAVINHWGQSNSYADANNDGTVNVDDLLIVVTHWTH